MDGIAALAGISDVDFSGRVESLEKENNDLRNSTYFQENETFSFY